MKNQERSEDTLPSSGIPVVTESADSRPEDAPIEEKVAEVAPIVEETEAPYALAEEATPALDQEAAHVPEPAAAEEVAALREVAPATVEKATPVVERKSVAPAAAEKAVVEPEGAPAFDEKELADPVEEPIAGAAGAPKARIEEKSAENTRAVEVTQGGHFPSTSEITNAKENEKPSPASLGREKREPGSLGRSSASISSSAPGASEAKSQSFRLTEADHEGKWFEAIEKKDCLSLMELLNAEGGDALRVSLCWKREEQGRTALHIAGMQGCFRLAKQVIDLVCNGCIELISGEDGISEVHKFNLFESQRNYIDAKDGRSGLTALEMADDIIGNTSIAQYIRYVRMTPEEQKAYARSGLYEAYPGTEWHTALAEGACGTLLQLLKYNSRYLLQTCGGFSVLQVAIWKGHELLVAMVVRAFRRGKVSWARESYFPAELSLEALVRGGKVLHRLKEMTKNDLTKIRKDLTERRWVESKISTVLPWRDETQRFLRSLFEHGVFKTDVTKCSIMNQESVELKPLESELLEFEDLLYLADIIEQCWNETVNVDECNAEFRKDVDYNFEDKSSLRFSILRFHYACKHPQQFEDFIHKTLSEFFQHSNHFCNLEVIIHDSQGRSPFHTLVDYYNPDWPFENLFKHTSIPQKIVELFCHTRDSRGRHPSLRAIGNQCINKKSKVYTHLIEYYDSEYSAAWFLKETLLSTNNTGVNKTDTFPTVYSWLLYGAVLFHDELILLNLFRLGNQKQNPGTLFPELHFGGDWEDTQTLHIAAAWGSQSILRLCLKRFDPMIEDAQGRTALHYAADASILKVFSPPLAFYCSIDHPRKAEVQWTNEREEELVQSNVKPDAQQDLNRNAHVGRKACILMLLQAGVDFSQEDKGGNIADPGTSYDASFQSWWYDLSERNTAEKKNSFNQAGNALSVVGTLVAATSYVGPLQPPLSYAHDAHNGYADTSKSLVNVFMVSNTLAFYLGVASVMFAVVPSLPMPQEGVLDELRRARHTVSSSLLLLLASIACILVSFGAASAVVIDSEHYYGAHDILLTPSVIGWFFCLIAIVSFFIRVMRLVFYRNPVIRNIYKFSFSKHFMKGGSAICEIVVTRSGIPAFIMGLVDVVYLLVMVAVLAIPVLTWMSYRTIRHAIRRWRDMASATE